MPKTSTIGRDHKAKKVKVTTAGGKIVETQYPRQFKMGGGEVCGATKKARQGQSAGECQLAAGWGTNHPGFGKCKFHGGSTPNHIKKNAQAQYHKLLGEELEIDPLNALLWCIRHAAGEMMFWQGQIDTLKNSDEWFEESIAGKQLHVYAREMRNARDAMHRYSSDAVKLGLQERHVRMAELYGAMIATLVAGIMRRLEPHLSKDVIDTVPVIVRDAMIEMEAMQAPIEKQLAA